MVLCRHSKVSKLTTPFNNQPFKVVTVTGRRVTAVANGRYITRHVTFFKPLKHQEDIQSSYYDLSPADKGVITTHLSPAQLSEQTSTVQPDESAEISSQGTVTDAVQDTEKKNKTQLSFLLKGKDLYERQKDLRDTGTMILKHTLMD